MVNFAIMENYPRTAPHDEQNWAPSFSMAPHATHAGKDVVGL
jgi:hypothetical protein